MKSERDFDGYDEERFGSFRWLRREARGPTYKSYSRFAQLSGCSFDWGSEGLAGSSNHGGELLALSAFSPGRGLVKAQGSFSTSLYASLSRMQIDFGGPATFGLEIARAEHAYDPKSDDDARNGSTFSLGDMVERGCFNHRWPFNEYYLDLHENLRIDGKEAEGEKYVQGAHVGTCQMFSFAKKGMFYQILRIEEGNVGNEASHSKSTFPEESQVVLTMGGPVWFRSFDADDRLRENNLTKKEEKERFESTHDISEHPENQGTTMRLWDRRRKIGLEARIYALHSGESDQFTYEQLELKESDAIVDNGTLEAQKRTNQILAYNAVFKLPYIAKNRARHPRSATFVAAIRFFGDSPLQNQNSENAPASAPWPSPPLIPKDIYEYVGVSSSNEQATGAMWDTIFIERLMKSESDMNLDEVNLIDRSLEKILQVDLVPAIFTKSDGRQHRRETTIVSNLFIRPNVDLEAVFWKIRFLVRAYKFLSRLRDTHQKYSGQHKAKPTGTDDNKTPPSDMVLHLSWSEIEIQVMVNVVKAQMSRIQRSIKSVIQFLVEALLKPDTKTSLMPDTHLLGDLNYYYVTTTIWYVVRNFPSGKDGWEWEWRNQIQTWKESGALFDPKRLLPDNWTFSSSDTDKVSLLQWYHYGSILGLCQLNMFPESREGQLDLGQKVFKLAKAAKISAAAKLSPRQPYEAEDEIIDRLSFLSIELGLEPRGYGRIGTVASLALKRVKGRDSTRGLNPGWLSPADKGPTSGPWEIHALCHHSRLVVLNLDEIDPQDWRLREYENDEIESLKRKIYLFQNAEGTLVPSWERAPAKVRDGWLHSEATAVVATTLLMMNEKDLKDKLLSSGAMDIEARRGSVDGLRADLARPPAPGEPIRQNQRNLSPELLHMESLLKDEFKVLEKFTGEVGRLPPVPWTKFSLPHRYHPLSFYNSLESTPELYTTPILENISIPSPLRSYTSLPQTQFSYSDLSQSLENLSISDITATGSDQGGEGFTWEISFYKVNAEIVDDLYGRLFDSLVDQEVQHRFIAMEDLKNSKALRNFNSLLVYVIHPESAPGLNDHVRKSSRFACQRGESWVASITLRNWQMVDPNQSKIQPSQTFKDDEPIYFPDYLKTAVWEDAPQDSLLKKFEDLCFKMCLQL